MFKVHVKRKVTIQKTATLTGDDLVKILKRLGHIDDDDDVDDADVRVTCVTPYGQESEVDEDYPIKIRWECKED